MGKLFFHCRDVKKLPLKGKLSPLQKKPAMGLKSGSKGEDELLKSVFSSMGSEGLKPGELLPNLGNEDQALLNMLTGKSGDKV